MARGRKLCSSCNTPNGPRSWQCRACGTGFVVKGVKHADIIIGDDTVDKNTGVSPRLWSLVEEYNGEDDKLFRQRYGVEGKTWESKCGKYRVREQYTYMGVDMKGNFSKCVYLLRLSKISKKGEHEDKWDVVKPKGKFKTPLAALRRMSKDMNGQMVKATTKAERLESRVSAIMKRKVSYA